MPARTHQSNAYQAWTYALAGLLALTNAAWFLSSRITANDHAAALKAAQTPPSVRVEERVVYRDANRQAEAAAELAVLREQRARANGALMREHAETQYGKANVRCYGSTLMVRDGAGWSSRGSC